MKFLGIILLAMTTCGQANMNQESRTYDEVVVMPDEIQKKYDFEVIMQGQVGGSKEAEIRVLKEKKGLSEIYKQINEGRSPKLNVPNVDYNKEIVLALFMGEKTTGGNAITVDTIEEKDDELVVYVKETSPSKFGYATSVITQPFCIVKIKKTDKPIQFKKLK